MAKSHKAVTEKQVPKEPPSRKRVVRSDSSDDEASASDEHQGRAHPSGPQGKAPVRAKAATGAAPAKQPAAAAGSHASISSFFRPKAGAPAVAAPKPSQRAEAADSDDDKGGEEEECWEEEESDDDDFESDDFEGRKGKGSHKRSAIGQRQFGKGKKHAGAKTTPAGRGDMSSAGKKPTGCDPPVLPELRAPLRVLSDAQMDQLANSRTAVLAARAGPGSRAPTVITRPTKEGQESKAVVLDMEALSAHFHISQKQAAKNLGVSKQTLITVCHRLGIKSWPSTRQDGVVGGKRGKQGSGGGKKSIWSALCPGEIVRDLVEKRIVHVVKKASDLAGGNARNKNGTYRAGGIDETTAPLCFVMPCKVW